MQNESVNAELNFTKCALKWKLSIYMYGHTAPSSLSSGPGDKL